MRRRQISHQIVETVPEHLEEGVLYISFRYGTALHRCCCGCGEEVVTPLNATDWSLTLDGNGATLFPSVGNWSFACRSHYWIESGAVIWAGPMSKRQIAHGRSLDAARKDEYFLEVNRNTQVDAAGWAVKLWRSIRRLWT